MSGNDQPTLSSPCILSRTKGGITRQVDWQTDRGQGKGGQQVWSGLVTRGPGWRGSGSRGIQGEVREAGASPTHKFSIDTNVPLTRSEFPNQEGQGHLESE